MGIVLIFFIMMYFLVSQLIIPREIHKPVTTEGLSFCTDGIMKQIVADVAFQGGYMELPQKVYSTRWGDVPMYPPVPSQEQLQKTIEQEASKRLMPCLDERYKKTGENVDVKVSLGENFNALITYPAKQQIGAGERTVAPINSRLPVRLLALQQAAADIFKLHQGGIPVFDLFDVEDKYNVRIFPVMDGNQTVYFFFDNEPSSKPQLVWVFGVGQ